MDSSNTSLDPGDLCDIANARTSRELYVKLFVINFTVVGSYYHLLRLRKEKFILPRLPIFIFFPHFILTDLTLLLIITLTTLACTGRGRKRSQTADRIGAMIGGFPPLEANSTRGPVNPQKPNTKTAIKLIMPLALLAQCMTSTYLFVRRRQRQATLLYGDHIMNIALGGLSIALLVILHVTIQPRVPHGPVSDNTINSKAGVVRLQDLSLFSEAQGGVDSMPFNIFWAAAKAYAASFAILIYTSVQPPLTVIRTSWIYYAAGVGVLQLLTQRRTARNGSMVVISYLGYTIISQCMLHVAYWFIEQGVPMFSSSAPGVGLASLEHLNAHERCPAAWQDPKSGYVWALA